jgi:hypothetical protein
VLLGSSAKTEEGPLNLDETDAGEELMACSKSIIEDMVTGICAIVPFMLGDINSAGRYLPEKKRIPLKGFKMTWPLHVALASTKQRSTRHAWMRQASIHQQRDGHPVWGLVANKFVKEPWILN